MTLTLLIAFALGLTASQGAPQLQFEPVLQPLIEARLKSFARSNEQRAQVMKKLFVESGCTGDKLTEQPVPHLDQPNLICVLPGADGAVVLVGAHFDIVQKGDGVVDNWSGAALLPSLYQSLSQHPRRHTYVFLAFSGEEKGLVGSEYYAKKLTKEEKSRIHAMVNLDTLGVVHPSNLDSQGLVF
ncbi:MAG: M28 family peptidase [Acidobacteria bacterium]|nr:M28 family peptidase [Acidobacteriota bacterium]MBI3663704.1 M28 family peptidase [Acidobacteriota bacterium]